MAGGAGLFVGGGIDGGGTGCCGGATGGVATGAEGGDVGLKNGLWLPFAGAGDTAGEAEFSWINLLKVL